MLTAMHIFQDFHALYTKEEYLTQELSFVASVPSPVAARWCELCFPCSAPGPGLRFRVYQTVLVGWDRDAGVVSAGPELRGVRSRSARGTFLGFLKPSQDFFLRYVQLSRCFDLCVQNINLGARGSALRRVVMWFG